MLIKNLLVIGRYWHWFRRPLLEQFQLNGPDLMILSFLEEHERINQDCLCTLLLLDKASMAKAAARLEKHGYIHRTVNEKNKREKLLELTDAGAQACDTLRALKARWEAICLEGFTQDERAQLACLLERAACNAVAYRKTKGYDKW